MSPPPRDRTQYELAAGHNLLLVVIENPLLLLPAVEPKRERADGDEDYVVRNQRRSNPVPAHGFNGIGQGVRQSAVFH